MGQGTSKYRKITRTPQTGENAGKKLWYATAVSDREMSFEDFVTHISEHNSPYSRGTIHGVLMDTLDCLKHLILDGKSVRFSDLGLFLHRYDFTWRGEQGEGDSGKRAGRAPDSEKHEDLEQLRAEEAHQDRGIR